MSDKLTIKGIGWDHVRCMGPLEASVDEYKSLHPEVDIVWHRRSLADFGEGRLEELFHRYDLIVFDHPYCGEIAANDWFVDFSKVLSKNQLKEYSADSLGPSWKSYQFAQGIWGLPIDAAAQVASCRPDLMSGISSEIPGTVEEVLHLGNKARDFGKWIALPAVPIDAICTFLSLAANAGVPVSRDKSFFPDQRTCIELLESIKAIVDLAHPQSVNWNPIACYEHMSNTDEVCYVPYAFGYSNYSRQNEKKRVQFLNIPGFKSADSGGALLGGAGIGVSSTSKCQLQAIDYAIYLCASEYQSTQYFINGGQPASLRAWRAPANNESTLNFFSGTLDTMQNSYLRPTYRGFVQYFRDAGRRIHAYLKDEVSAEHAADWLRKNYFL